MMAGGLGMSLPSNIDAPDYKRRALKLGHFKVMFDFKDFNSAHRLASQKTAIRTLFAKLPDDWRCWLERSIDNIWIRNPDDTWGRVRGTLMSGHRMTSIINSILNAAYTRLAIGEERPHSNSWFPLFFIYSRIEGS